MSFLCIYLHIILYIIGKLDFHKVDSRLINIKPHFLHFFQIAESYIMISVVYGLTVFLILIYLIKFSVILPYKTIVRTQYDNLSSVSWHHLCQVSSCYASSYLKLFTELKINKNKKQKKRMNNTHKLSCHKFDKWLL